MLRASSLAGANARPSDTTADAKHDETNQQRVLLALTANGVSVFSLPEVGVLTVGRADECQVQLRDALVSRHHANLHVSPLAIEDRGSANGTWLADVRLEPNKPVALTEGQVVHVGNGVLIVRRAAASALIDDSRGSPPMSRRRIASDPRTLELYARAERLALGDFPILIEGETGVGKDLLASAIHAASLRNDGPFVRVDCAALAEPQLESELFGHERGAFSGAVSTSRGLIEAADGGSVFLDEVGELPLAAQAKLLRLLEAGEVTPVGSLRPRKVSVRFVAASNQDLRAQVERGRFRSDLLYRLNGANLRVPPLRERPLDIIPLANEFLGVAAQLGLLRTPELTAEAQVRLEAHAWPGNVRELRYVIERAVLTSDGRSITATDLRLEEGNGGAAGHIGNSRSELEANARPGARPRQQDTNRPESPAQQQTRERIQRALAECGGNQSRAAEYLGIPRRTLVRKIAQLQLPRPRSEH